MYRVNSLLLKIAVRWWSKRRDIRQTTGQLIMAASRWGTGVRVSVFRLDFNDRSQPIQDIWLGCFAATTTTA